MFVTEQSDGAHAFEEGRETWAQNSSRNPRAAVTPIEGQFPMHNAINVQFESPKVPVIFVLGGPGSGKVTHCDNLMQEKTGVVHINMTDLLQQYVVGNGKLNYHVVVISQSFWMIPQNNHKSEHEAFTHIYFLCKLRQLPKGRG
ncbi:hypothetical protein Trydic_g7888 [Trypoxylus dichotomus]